MGLKPEVSITTGLAVSALVWTIYQKSLPSDAEIRVASPHDPDIDSSRKKATYTAVAAVSAVSLIAKDATVFILGGASVVVLDWWTRHSNAVDPDLGRVFVPGRGGTAGTPNSMPALQEDAGPTDPGYVG